MLGLPLTMGLGSGCCAAAAAGAWPHSTAAPSFARTCIAGKAWSYHSSGIENQSTVRSSSSQHNLQPSSTCPGPWLLSPQKAAAGRRHPPARGRGAPLPPWA